MKYRINIEQSHSFMSDEPKTLSYTLDDIIEFCILDNSATQIGANRQPAIYCLNLYIRPSGLTIPVFIQIHQISNESIFLIFKQ